jgi:hypothetical protein
VENEFAENVPKVSSSKPEESGEEEIGGSRIGLSLDDWLNEEFTLWERIYIRVKAWWKCFLIWKEELKRERYHRNRS